MASPAPDLEDEVPPSDRDGAGPAAEADPQDLASPLQKGVALVVAGGLLLLIAGTVVTLNTGGCLFDRSGYYVDCTGVVRAPWFGLTVLVTVAAATVGTVLALRDLSRTR